MAVKNENKKIQEAKQEEKIELITKSLAKGLNAELIADITGVSVDFVLSVQRQLSEK